MCELTAGYTKPLCASFGGTKSVIAYNTENQTAITIVAALWLVDQLGWVIG